MGEAEREGAEAAVLMRLGQGLALPAFGHPLYPDGDVRAALLLEQVKLPPVCTELREAGVQITGDQPNVDFALAAIAAAHDLPRGAPLQLFALGRTVGWLAHALEQVMEGQLIRPRASYQEPGG